MLKFFLKIYDYLQVHKRLCFGFLIVIILGLLALIASLSYNENIYDFLPISANEQKAITLYQDISGGQRVVVMFKANNDSIDPSELTESVDLFKATLLKSDVNHHISDITTQVDFETVSNITNFVYHNMPVMLNDSDYTHMEQMLVQPDFADQQFSADVEMLLTPVSGLFNASIENDPLGLFSSVLERLQDRQSNLPFEIENGYIFTNGQKYALALITSPYGAMESANNSRLVEFVDSVAQVTMSHNPQVHVAMTGAPVIAVGNAKQIKKDSQWAISIAVTLILLLLLYSFRKVKNILLIGLAILFGWLFAMGLISVFRSDVSLIVLGIGSIIIGIAVNYPLHFIAHTSHGGTIREVLKEMIAPLLIGNITTVGAFASLMPLDAPALRDLGLFAAFMLIGTIIFVLVFLPHLVSQRLGKSQKQLSFGKISSFSLEKYHWLFWALLVLTIIFGYFSLRTSFDANMHHINYMSSEQTTLLSELNASAGINDTTNIYIISEGDSWDSALNQSGKMRSVIDTLLKSGQINKCSNVTSFICSEKEQQRRIDKWNEFWVKHRDEIKSIVKQYAPKYGFEDSAFESFFEIIDNTYSPQPFDYYDPIRTTLLDNAFSESTGRYSVVEVADVKGKSIENVEKTINEAMKDNGYAFDFVGMNSSIARSLSDDFNYIGFACGFIVFLFLWLSFGRLELTLMAFLPMAMGWLWILGIMYLLGMQFNIVNVILATFIFGQGDDYTIFITEGVITEYAYHKKMLASFKNSIIISSLIMFIGMGSLIVAKHPALHSLAEVTIVGMITVVVMAWIVPVFIFSWIVKSKGKYRYVPITLGQIIRTAYCAIVYIVELVVGCILGVISRLLGKSNDNWFHKLICSSMRFNVNHIWGVKSVIKKSDDEALNRGGIIICNHQSMLDSMCLLALSPKVLIMTKGKAWKNPLLHLAGFINSDAPIGIVNDKVSSAIERGYNVVCFSETQRRMEDVANFPEKAFYLAQEIGADIIPVYIHGSGHIMPKGSALLSRGRIDLEVGKRIPSHMLSGCGDTHQAIACKMRDMCEKHLHEMKRSIEDTHYFHHYINYKYIYKGFTIERETRRLLKKYDDFSNWIDTYQSEGEQQAVSIVNAGKGQFALLFALVHPETNVVAYSLDEDDAALLKAVEPFPVNLTVNFVDNEAQALDAAQGTTVFNLSELLK